MILSVNFVLSDGVHRVRKLSRFPDLMHEITVLHINVFRLRFLQGVPVFLPVHAIDVSVGPRAPGQDGIDFSVVFLIQ